MSIRDFIFLLSGLTISLIILYFLILNKFLSFINHERDQNELYRFNAEQSFLKANEEIEEQENSSENEENFTNW